MCNTIIRVVSIFTVFDLKYAASLGTDCFEYENGVPSYTGTTSVTRSGKTCERWDSVPHVHNYPMDSEQQNYCRNPDGLKTLWCYTTHFWEHCDIPECASLGTDCFEYENGVPSYTGTTSVTRSGKTCERWDSVPHVHNYPMDSEQQNYCRNPDGLKTLWCYTTHFWEHCDIPECDPRTVIVTVKNTQATSTTSVSIRDSTTVDFMNMIISDTSPSITTQNTPYNLPELSSTTSENANTAISTIIIETLPQTSRGIERIDRLSTETETVTNTQATNTTSASIRESTSAFMNMITSNTSLATVTHRIPSTTPELFSKTYAYSNTAISTLLTETSTQATPANGEWSPWTFCEVNCVREDTTEGIQRRWRKCKGAKCSSTDIEERPCSKREICKGMRPRKLLCKCSKRLVNRKWYFLDGKNITDAEVKKMVLEDFNKNIKSELSVDKKTVSKEVRKKTSSVNKRKSSQSIGWGCIVFLILPMGFLIAIDIMNCCIHFRTRLTGRKRNRIRPMSNIQDQRDSSKPLQENVNIYQSYYASRCDNNFHLDEMKRDTYHRRRNDNNQQSRDEWLQYI